MIEKITIKDVASYDSVEGVEIDQLRKLNYIYGSNGTGKTTISNVLQDYISYDPNNVTVKWGADDPVKVLVYNKRFRDDNFGKGKIAGVFTLGKATKEEIEEVEQLKIKQSQVLAEGKKKKESIEKEEKKRAAIISTFIKWSWAELYKKNEPQFKSAFDGYRNGKEKFAKKIEKEARDNKNSLCNITDLLFRAETIFKTTPTKLDLIDVSNIGIIRSIEIEDIWGKRIVGRSDIPIAKLISQLNISDWVNQGKNIVEHSGEVCPFCQQKTVDEDFKKQLSDFFDGEYALQVNLIKEYKDQYIQGAKLIIETLNNIEAKESKLLNSKLNMPEFSANVVALSSIFSENITIITNKQNELSRKFDLTSTLELATNIKALVNDANKEITKHNLIVLDYTNERAKLIADIWKYISSNAVVGKFIKDIDSVNKAIAGMNTARQDLLQKYSKIKNDIKEKNKNITSVQPAIDSINEMLAKYGFEGFSIVPSKEEANFYQICRSDGTIAEDTLSEGEVTFITFLYYLQLVNGGVSAENVLEDRVLVIDDPISSLDSTILFIVSSQIKEIIKRVRADKDNSYSVKQIFILTHNVYFHKEVSFIDGRATDNSDVGYWIIRKSNGISNITSYEKNNPIRGSYEMLWDEIREPSNISIITVQNTMRRILEVYFKTMGGYKDDEILNKIDRISEKEICRSLMIWTNDGSHCISDDLYHVPNSETVENYLKVFRRIFDALGHIGHYKMMMKEDDTPKRLWAVG